MALVFALSVLKRLVQLQCCEVYGRFLTISKDELVAVEEIGPTMADSIIEYREDPQHIEIINGLIEAGLKWT